MKNGNFIQSTSWLYVNLTNKCPCACTFCLRQTMDHVGKAHSLWLEREPSAEEVIAEFAKFDMNASFYS